MSLELGIGPRFDFFVNDRSFLSDLNNTLQNTAYNLPSTSYIAKEDTDFNKFIYGFDSKLKLKYFTDKMFYGLGMSSYNNLNKVYKTRSAYNDELITEWTFIFSLSVGFKIH